MLDTSPIANFKMLYGIYKKILVLPITKSKKHVIIIDDWVG